MNEVQSFVADNREALGTTSDKLAAVTTALTDSLDDVKQFAARRAQRFAELRQHLQPGPGRGDRRRWRSTTSPTRSPSCAAQSRPRPGWAPSNRRSSASQYLAPIIKNRQYNFPPLGQNLFVGATGRPNEITYSEDWMRPDYVPPHRRRAHRRPRRAGGAPLPAGAPPPPAEATRRRPIPPAACPA